VWTCGNQGSTMTSHPLKAPALHAWRLWRWDLPQNRWLHSWNDHLHRYNRSVAPASGSDSNLSKTATSNHFFSDFFYVSWTVALRAQGSHACDALLGQMQAPAGNPEGQWPLPRLSGKHGKLKKYKERRDQMRDATGSREVVSGRPSSSQESKNCWTRARAPVTSLLGIYALHAFSSMSVETLSNSKWFICHICHQGPFRFFVYIGPFGPQHVMGPNIREFAWLSRLTGALQRPSFWKAKEFGRWFESPSWFSLVNFLLFQFLAVRSSKPLAK